MENQNPNPAFKLDDKNPESIMQGRVECKLIDALPMRARFAFYQRRAMMTDATKRVVVGAPDYMNLDDDAILALYEQQYRRDAKKTYGHIPGHYDWFRQQHVERDPPLPADQIHSAPADPEFKAPWAKLSGT